MTTPLATDERVAHHRSKPRAQDLRPVQLRVLDTSAPGFADECRRQSALIRDHATEASRTEDEAWERISDESTAG